MSRLDRTPIVMAGALALFGLVLAPAAHADPTLDQITEAVATVRESSGCPDLAYSPQLEAAAQQLVRAGSLNANGYPGVPTPIVATSAPTAAAIEQALSFGNGHILDCRNTDLGVGMVGSGEYSVVGLVLGAIRGPQAAQGS
ncbi:hypothetical protein ACFQWH_05085 [Mycolicibacterium sp. GCM10028919]|jgi:hypothetical protein|uniref:hypothetical protein n=1 Tax=Mycolicibacterium sp. GCM10028919 TaxID=3273401 RepID=UPI0036092C07